VTVGALVLIDGLTVVHPGRAAALSGVGFALAPGEQVALLGPSGAGKSTLLRAVLGDGPVSAGRVRVDGLDPCDRRFQRRVRRAAGAVLQGGDLVPSLSARANVLAGASHLLDRSGWLALARGRTPRALADRVQTLATEQGVAELLDVPVERLSGGQRQRVAVVRALLGVPRLLLADEPTAGLDPATARYAVDALLGQSVTVLVATHDPSVAARFARVVALREGRVVHDGPPLDQEHTRALYATQGAS
jgi:ABC-type phosphate/phosphonate transport system ATPase subunit